VKASNLELDAWSLRWGDPAGLDRMAAAIAAFNARLAAEGRQCTRRDLLAIQNALNALAIEIGRVERMVTERIAAISTGVRNVS